MKNQKVELGCEVQDTVSGFKGIAFGITLFLNGCSRVGVQAKMDKDGKLPDAQWFDQPQLKVTKTAAQTNIKQGPRNVGGPMTSIPTRNSCK